MEGHENQAFDVQYEDSLQLHVSISYLVTYCSREEYFLEQWFPSCHLWTLPPLFTPSTYLMESTEVKYVIAHFFGW